MRGPYLESGESIVLTTDRVSVDDMVYDAMLTTRQLVLIDNLYARFEPRIIPLSTIQSVRSGKAATGEPVIIIGIQQTGEEVAGTRIIIFLQEPLENRKHDRDLWVQKLIGLSVSGRGEGVLDEVLPKKESEGMHPSVRRWVAPEITRPRSDNFPVQDSRSDAIITLDEPAKPPEHPVELFSPVEEREGAPESADREIETGVVPVQAPEPDEQAISMSERCEPAEEFPDTVTDDTVSSEIPANSSPSQEITETSKSITASILAAVRSLTGHRDEVPASREAETGAGIGEERNETPGTPIRPSSPLPEDHGEFLVMGDQDEPVEPARLVMPAGQEPLPIFDEVDHGVRTSSQIPEIASEQPQAAEPAMVQGAAAHPVGTDSEPGLREGSLDGEELETPVGAEEKTPAEAPAGPGTPHTDTSDAPPPAPLPWSHPLIIAGGVFLCLLLVIGIIILLPGSIPTQEHVPVTVPATIIPTVTLIPSQPAVTPDTVRQDGVHVRVISPGFFTGQAGNPGYLQPVSGSGETEIRVLDPTDLVSVSVEKQEYTGDELRVEIYRNNTLIASESTTAPAGSIVMLIDPSTGNPPGIPLPTPATGNTTGTGQLEYY